MKQYHLLQNSWIRKYSLQTILAFDEILNDDAFFITDAEQKIVFWSKGAEALLGFTAEESVGEHCLKSHRCSQCLEGCGVAKHRTLDDISLSLYRKDGSSIQVLKTARALMSRDNEVMGTIEFLRPIRTINTQKFHHDTENLHGMLSCASSSSSRSHSRTCTVGSISRSASDSMVPSKRSS